MAAAPHKSSTSHLQVTLLPCPKQSHTCCRTPPRTFICLRTLLLSVRGNRSDRVYNKHVFSKYTATSTSYSKVPFAHHVRNYSDQSQIQLCLPRDVLVGLVWVFWGAGEGCYFFQTTQKASLNYFCTKLFDLQNHTKAYIKVSTGF